MTRARLLLAAALLGATMTIVGPSAGPVRAFPGSHVKLTGHGWGHGRGMGQFGAQGFATIYGWNYNQILERYYSNTTMGDAGNPPISVHITRIDGRDVIVEGSTRAGGVLVRRVGANQFHVYTGAGCGGPWSGPSVETGPVHLNSSSTLVLCDTDGSRRQYRGRFEVVDGAGTSRLVNHLDTQGYLYGVVPRESPSSFHIEALKAQSVAARSYALSANCPHTAYANVDDTTFCQVYGGKARNSENLETVNAAVDATAGQVRRHSNGLIARTEFSSSTGGYTAGGTFPAVIDEGDAVASNPNHTWTAEVPVASIQGAYPHIGTLLSVDVTSRNGLGDWGGRVRELVLRGTHGNQVLSGDTFRSKFGLKSDWFLVTNNATGGVDGYWVVAPDGGVFAFGNAGFFGSMGGRPLNQPIVGMAAVPDSAGYWLVASDGGIFSFGSAGFHGSTGGMRLNQPVVGMTVRKGGQGYWLVASDGGIFSFDAPFFGSMGGQRLNQPVVGMAATPSGNGYWLVASDGGIFSFGDATFHGSTGSMRLNQPIVGMAATPDGGGYWLVGADGGIFAFGNAGYFGSLPGLGIPGPVDSMAATATGGGYEIVTKSGRVYPFGDAPYFGDVLSAVPGYRGGVEGIDVRRS